MYCRKCGNKDTRSSRKFAVIMAAEGGAILLVCFLLLFMRFGLPYLSGYDEGITEQAFQNYMEFDGQLLTMEQSYLTEDGYVDSKDVDSLLNEIESAVIKGVNDGKIKKYNRGEDNLYIEYAGGIPYIFVPMQKGMLSGADQGGSIVTLEPVKNDFALLKSKFSVEIDNWANKLPYDSNEVTACADMIQNHFPELYWIESEKANGEITIEEMKNIGNHSVVILEGHGAYNEEVHSCLVTSEVHYGYWTEFAKHKEDLENKNLILTSHWNGLSPVHEYCITSKFFDTYLSQMDHSIIFLGSCYSLKDDVLAEALLNKGAQVVIGYTDTVAMEYEMHTRAMFFYSLTENGNQSVYDAVEYTKARIGNGDAWDNHAVLKVLGNSEGCSLLNRQGTGTISTENTETMESTVNTERETDVDLYARYRKLIAEYETQYGSSGSYSDGTGRDYLTGLCFLKLVDFDRNGKEELLLVHGEAKQENGYDYVDYQYEIWGEAQTDIQLLSSGELFGTNGGVKTVCLVDRDNQTYLLTGSADSFENDYYYGYLTSGFGMKYSMEYDGDNLYKLNGAIVTQQEWQNEYTLWNNVGDSGSAQNKIMYHLNVGDVNPALSATQETKTALAL